MNPKKSTHINRGLIHQNLTNYHQHSRTFRGYVFCSLFNVLTVTMIQQSTVKWNRFEKKKIPFIATNINLCVHLHSNDRSLRRCSCRCRCHDVLTHKAEKTQVQKGDNLS